jgi:hypothetical protein|uniref:Uncharacterized protein n=1 Tax=uncultured marine virus TaxID=186617 RepID=A0A0F7L2N6_9VIRU|nr:hypothetical protein [uncultured marine virus]
MTTQHFPSFVPVGEIRAAAILTGSYVVAQTFGRTLEEKTNNIESSHILIDYDFTKGSLTTADIKVEYSADGSTWFQHTSVSTSAGVATVSSAAYRLGASGVGTLAVPLIKHPYLRVSAIGNGTATGSSLTIDVNYIS